MRGEEWHRVTFGSNKNFERPHDPSRFVSAIAGPRFVKPKPGHRSARPIRTRPIRTGAARRSAFPICTRLIRTGARSTRFVAPKPGQQSAHHPIRTRPTRTGARSTKIRRAETRPAMADTTTRCINDAAGLLHLRRSGRKPKPRSHPKSAIIRRLPRRNQQHPPETTSKIGIATAQHDNSRTAVAPPLNGNRKRRPGPTNSGERKKGMRQSHTHFKGCDSHFKG